MRYNHFFYNVFIYLTIFFFYRRVITGKGQKDWVKESRKWKKNSFKYSNVPIDMSQHEDWWSLRFNFFLIFSSHESSVYAEMLTQELAYMHTCTFYFLLTFTSSSSSSFFLPSSLWIRPDPTWVLPLHTSGASVERKTKNGHQREQGDTLMRMISFAGGSWC